MSVDIETINCIIKSQLDSNGDKTAAIIKSRLNSFKAIGQCIANFPPERPLKYANISQHIADHEDKSCLAPPENLKKKSFRCRTRPLGAGALWSDQIQLGHVF